MKGLMIVALAIVGLLAFTPVASAQKNGHGWGWGSTKNNKAMPLRSNKGGELRGQDRARYVHGLNRAKKKRY